MKRKILSLFMAIVLCALLFNVPSSSAATYGDLTYQVTNGWVTIKDCSETATKVEIPSKINGYPVTSIDFYAFMYCTSLISITIPDSVTFIGDYAFYGCESLTSINIPDSVTSIGEATFYYCCLLTSITIPDSVTSIGYGAFGECYDLKSITIPDSVTSIGDYAFSDCNYLTSITIPDSVTSIGDYAFSWCDSLTNITVSENNEYYSSADGVLFNKDKTILCTYPYGKSDTTYTIPDSVTSIGYGAFSGCDGLRRVTIPDSVTSIGDGAFYDCYFRSITIPDSVTSIGNSAFDHCFYLTDVYYNGSEEDWSNITIGSGNTYLTNATIHFTESEIDYAEFYNYDKCSDCNGIKILNYKGGLGEDITIPNKIDEYAVCHIEESAFENCYDIKSIVIPDSVTSIGESAFNACSSLTSITIPDSVTSIGNSAFSYCESLTSITIPDSVTSIGDSAFSDCDSLTSINIPDSVTSIGNYAFLGCNSLTSITIPEGVTSIGNHAFWCCYDLTSIIIPEGVTSIGDYAFSHCNSLISINIPDSVTSIGSSAFCYSESLTGINVSGDNEYYSSVGGVLFNKDKTILCTYPAGKSDTTYTIPDSVTSIVDYAFLGCDSLTSITIPDSVTSIGIRTFYNCESLTSINIPDSLTSIGNTAFYGCSSLSDVYYDGTKSEWAKITIGNNNTRLTDATLHAKGSSFDNAIVAKANKDYTVTTESADELVYFSFVPEHSKEYCLYTKGAVDTYGYLYDSNKTELASCDNNNDSDNFYISYSLTAGETYYIAVKGYSPAETFTFTVEEPVDYKINSITVKDMSNNELSAIPEETFLATVSFTNVSSSTDTVIVLAQYSSSGEFKGLMYVNTEDVPVGATMKLTLPVDNTKGDIDILKAFCWESFETMLPMGKAVTF